MLAATSTALDSRGAVTRGTHMNPILLHRLAEARGGKFCTDRMPRPDPNPRPVPRPDPIGPQFRDLTPSGVIPET